LKWNKKEVENRDIDFPDYLNKIKISRNKQLLLKVKPMNRDALGDIKRNGF
jgi:YesN/AraC family two-component response regulator